MDISKNVDIGWKSIKELGSCLLRCENLKKLNLSGCDFTNKMISELIASSNHSGSNKKKNHVGYILTLESLDLSENPDISKEAYSKLLNWLCSFEKFKELKLSNNDISSESMLCIAKEDIFLRKKVVSLNLS